MALNNYPKLLPELVASGAFAGRPLTLIDVGCAFGIEAHWRHFPLRARAIDPMVREIERLRSLERDPAIEYISGFVRQPGHPEFHIREADTDNYAFARSSAYYVAKRSTPVGAWAWGAEQLSNREVTLDALSGGLGGVDFVKTDTDGGDLEVLSSGAAMLRNVLGVSVEAIISSGTHPQSNSRSNIDRYLRGLGFSLFDEQTYRYSRAALPDCFLYAVPAQTNRGQVVWSQCLYLRDLKDDASDDAVLKMIGIFELYELNDCAAELIQARPETIAPFIDPTEALDLLTAGWMPQYTTYAALRATFDADISAFFPR